jgi:hypothetical protein
MTHWQDQFSGSTSDWKDLVFISVGELWVLSCGCRNNVGTTARRLLPALHLQLEFQPHKALAKEDAAAIVSLLFIWNVAGSNFSSVNDYAYWCFTRYFSVYAHTYGGLIPRVRPGELRSKPLPSYCPQIIIPLPLHSVWSASDNIIKWTLYVC